MQQSGSLKIREDTYDSADVNACQDAFRYKLVEEDGRLRFLSVQATQGMPCSGATLAAIIEMLEGAWLDEIDPARLTAISCTKGSSCPRTLAAMVRDLQELLL